jgi:hypothetical protein
MLGLVLMVINKSLSSPSSSHSHSEVRRFQIALEPIQLPGAVLPPTIIPTAVPIVPKADENAVVAIGNVGIAAGGDDHDEKKISTLAAASAPLPSSSSTTTAHQRGWQSYNTPLFRYSTFVHQHIDSLI